MLHKMFVMLLGVTALMAQNTQEVNPYMKYVAGLSLESFTVSSSYRSEYVFSTGATLSDKPVIQTDFFAKTKCGLFLDVWNSLPADLSRTGKDYGTEIYSTIGWMGKVRGLNTSFGFGYEDLHNVLRAEGTDWLILSGEVSRDFTPFSGFTISPFGRVEVNFTLDGETIGESLPKAGARYSFKVTDGVRLAGRAMIVYDPGLAGGDVAYVNNLDGALLWKLGKRCVIELPFVRHVAPLTQVDDGRKSGVVFGAGVAFTF
jgi:hypothetical protein